MPSRTRRAAAILLSIATLLLVGPAAAHAACPVGGSGVTYNAVGEAARFKSLRPAQGMNCASARYVMNRWLRRAWTRTSSHALPTRFFDGYVTWYCGRTSRTGWRCDEYETGTAFRFVAYRF